MWHPDPPIKHDIPGARWPSEAEAAGSRWFSPVRIGAVTLEQRTWVPAMVPWRATEEGDVTPEVLAWYERFARAVSEIDEIVGFYRMSGEVDYLLHVVVPDIAGYDAVYKRLIARIELSDVSSSFAMEVIKETTRLPLAHSD